MRKEGRSHKEHKVLKPERTEDLRMIFRAEPHLLSPTFYVFYVFFVAPLFLFSEARHQSASNLLIHSSSTEGSNSGFGNNA